jgi:GTP cyclohydrolase FolE2
MATSISSVSSTVQSGYAQLKVQQARRNAEQAEVTAQALSQQAQQAKSEASQAQENARQLSVQSDRAQTGAVQARQGLMAMRSAAEAGDRLGTAYDRIAQAIGAKTETTTDVVPAEVPVISAAPATTPTATTASPVVNDKGQTTGTLINIVAS